MSKEKNIASFSNLSTSFGSTSFRRSFKVDPINTLSKIGIDTTAIDMKVVDSLVELSDEELNVLAKMQTQFAGSEDLASFTGGVIF